jgi:ribosomal protein L11 methylase PrmA
MLDAFGGTGTVALVATRLGRSALVIDLDPGAIAQARMRLHLDPLVGTREGGDVDD